MAKRPYIHIIPFSNLGGCEKNCLEFIKADSGKEHHILVLDKDGPISKYWLKAGAHVSFLNCIDNNKQIFVSISNYLLAYPGSRIIYWSNLKLPIIRYALKNSRATLAVHVGNPVNLSFTSLLKYLLYHSVYHSKINTKLFCCSHHVQKSVLKNLYFKKFESFVIRNPIELATAKKIPIRQLAYNDSIIFGMTARLDLIKDHSTVIHAFTKIVRNYPNSQLWFIGDGDQRINLQELSTKLQIEKNIVFWGNVDNVYELLQKMDVFLYSTTMKEGFGNVVAEALANGLPCIVSDLPMMHEVLLSKENVYFEPGNSDLLAKMCIDIIENVHFRTKLSDINFKTAQDFYNPINFVKEIEVNCFSHE